MIALYQRKALTINIRQVRPIFTDVVSIRAGLRLILQAMALGPQGIQVTISSEVADQKEGSFEKFSLLVSAPGWVIYGERSLTTIFSAEPLRDALGHLRGYVDWTVRARFADGFMGEFDVMRNRLLRPVDGPAGVQHRLTFHRYVP
jgi:hypothetical protein